MAQCLLIFITLEQHSMGPDAFTCVCRDGYVGRCRVLLVCALCLPLPSLHDSDFYEIFLLLVCVFFFVNPSCRINLLLQACVDYGYSLLNNKLLRSNKMASNWEPVF